MSAEVVAVPAEGAAGAAGVLQVTLRHEGRLNAMSRAMWRQLRTVFEGVQRSSEVRCVLIQGAGEAFCAGGDISEYPAFRFDAALLRDFHENDVWGGLQAMLDCALGDVTARQMLLEASTFSAAEMEARGFLSRVVADDLLAVNALASACRIAALAPAAARMNKQTFRVLKMPLEQAAVDPYAYANSAEHREGITAFLAKRTPVF